ncbi:hypothetical protein SAMN05421676_105101 [Salinibacillus kushneri]|uniref:Uncharacterized protein n=1 Tax=Salinibacillus kushneri TaxID=237682 RepID=A0A1I0EY39_9BACI|nr:hypothetical protein SAMN05421676_105101 [Salinibacillus kushneri]
MGLIKNSILMFIILLINFIIWDYVRHGEIMWIENIMQSLSFVILFRLFKWFINSSKNNHTKKESD